MARHGIATLMPEPTSANYGCRARWGKTEVLYMSNPWFRMYAEFASDAKVQIMPENMQRRLLMLFCLRCGNVSETLHETELAFALRISDDELQETKALFLRKGFIDEGWNILNWDKRQYKSDTSTERVRRHRTKYETLPKRKCNVSETPPDTDTDTDTEKEEGFVLPDWILKSDWKDYEAMRVKKEKPMTDSIRMMAVLKLATLKDAGQDVAAVIQQSTFNGWPGFFEVKKPDKAFQPAEKVDDSMKAKHLKSRRDKLGHVLDGQQESWLKGYEAQNGEIRV